MTATPAGHLYEACGRCKRNWVLRGQLCRHCAYREKRKSEPTETEK